MAVGTFAAGFLDWFTKVINVDPWDGTFDHYGKENYGPAVQLYCYIEEKIRTVRDQTGKMCVSNTTVYVGGGPLDPHDRFTMPVGFKGPNPPTVISVSNVYDHNEYSHCEVYL